MMDRVALAAISLTACAAFAAPTNTPVAVNRALTVDTNGVLASVFTNINAAGLQNLYVPSPSSPSGAVTRSYADSAVAGCVSLSGATMSGNLILDDNSGSSPSFILRNETEEYGVIQRTLTQLTLSVPSDEPIALVPGPGGGGHVLIYGGLNVGGTDDPGDNNLLVVGTVACADGAAPGHAATVGQLTAVSAPTWHAAGVVTGASYVIDYDDGLAQYATISNSAASVSFTNFPAGALSAVDVRWDFQGTNFALSFPANLTWAANLDAQSNHYAWVHVAYDGNVDEYLAIPIAGKEVE